LQKCNPKVQKSKVFESVNEKLDPSSMDARSKTRTLQ